MYADLFHLYPTDKYVNAQRADFPYGETNHATTTTYGNGSKKGTCTFPGYSGTVFEVIDEYKGDFARTYFYMATRYEDQIAQWNSPMFAGNSTSVFTTWSVNLLLKWHRQDPVSDKETTRNNAVYTIQHNRNPFIDYPELAELIWGDDFGHPFLPPDVAIDELTIDNGQLTIYPNPCRDVLHVLHIETQCIASLQNEVIEIYNIIGKPVMSITSPPLGGLGGVDLSHLPRGTYILKITTENLPPIHRKIIKY
jgi:hypothetical protein